MSASDKIRVVLADDHRIVREALKGLLVEAGCDVVGEAGSGESAVAMAIQLKPHVLVLDIGMPGLGGMAAAHHIAREAPSTRVLVLSQYDDEEYVVEALGEAGAAGYLVKTDAASELIGAVRTVHAGRRYVSPSVAPIVLARMRDPAAASNGAGRLTPRERDVIRLIGEGSTTKEVAQRLGISPKTAQVHRENIKQKLDLRTTAAMIRYAIKHKIIRVE